MAGLWFKPVCDDLLGKIHRWWVNYERGEIFSTREWLDREGNKVDKPTRYAYRIPFRPLEIQHLVSILEALAPANSLTKDMKELHESMKHRFIHLNLKNRPRLLPTGEWMVTLAWYKADIEEVLTLLLEARSGKSQTIESLAAQQKEQGKDLFEV
jgi:hypothetical protein